MTTGADPHPLRTILTRASRAMLGVCLAWLPFFVTWVLLVRLFANQPIGSALVSGALAVGNAALLGLGVWTLTGRLTWPDRVYPAFYGWHLLAAAVYSGGWIVSGHLEALVFTGEGTLWMLVASQLIGWRFLMGLYLYGLVAGVCYAIRMRRWIVVQEALAARAHALAVEARLQSLRAQVNPHFLFNALHTVSALTRRDPAVAREALEQLGALLRYTLRDDGREQVTLNEEWQFASNYLDLERLRLADRLQVSCAIADEASAALVPSFLIQGLVENAVRHGIAPLPSGGTVTITADAIGSRLVICVADDGVGAGIAPPAADVDTTLGGRGLHLLRERLQAIHGETASLDAGPAELGGYAVVVTLPLIHSPGLSDLSPKTSMGDPGRL